MRLHALALLVALLGGTPAVAAPAYTLIVNSDYQNAWTAPCRLDTTSHVVTASGDGVITSTQFASVCGVGASVSAATTNLGSSSGTNFSVWPRASTDDFVIAGSGSYVSGTMYFRFRAHVSGSGGVPGCRSDVMPWITIGGNVYNGGFRATNQAGYPPYQAWGSLQGATPAGDIDTVLAITKTWPVNAPFSVELSLVSDALTSVTTSWPTATWTANAGGFAGGAPAGGLTLGNASGKVMNLPDSYSLSSASWHVANSQRGAYAAVGDGQRPAMRFALAGVTPNPSAGARLSVAFALPDGAPATLELLDLAGRRVAVRDLGSPGAGAHRADLSAARRLPPGLYLVRLTQGGASRVARVSVIE